MRIYKFTPHLHQASRRHISKTIVVIVVVTRVIAAKNTNITITTRHETTHMGSMTSRPHHCWVLKQQPRRPLAKGKCAASGHMPSQSPWQRTSPVCVRPDGCDGCVCGLMAGRQRATTARLLGQRQAFLFLFRCRLPTHCARHQPSSVLFQFVAMIFCQRAQRSVVMNMHHQNVDR
jgi:hypothetical protein